MHINEKIKELIAIGASIAANCQPCLEYHVAKAREHDAAPEEISVAIEVGKTVRRGAATKMDRYAEDYAVPKAAPPCPSRQKCECDL